jgi:hypothetical protein
MSWPKGKPRPPGSGRKKGSTNRINRDIKAMIEEALHKAGGVKYLVKQANANPAAFMGLVGRILPKDISGEVKVTGEFTLVDLLTRVDQRSPIKPIPLEGPKPH